MKKKNHFVPKFYLKNFADDSGKVFEYRTLVPSNDVPTWKHRHISEIGYRDYLYVGFDGSKEFDDLEDWIRVEVEVPAEAALRKAVNDEKLTAEDWRRLIKFAVALDVRNPAHLRESLERWSIELPGLIQSSLERSVARLEQSDRREQYLATIKPENFPSRIKIHEAPNRDSGIIEANILAGRSLWHGEIKRVLTNTINKIPARGWTILRPPKGEKFFISDRPVVKLNYWTDVNYNLGGGWGKDGTDIFVPLSPQHLLYTQVGRKVPARGDKLNPRVFEKTMHFLAERADRSIFSRDPIEGIQNTRQRIVDREQYAAEKALWSQWHCAQISAEQEFRSS